ncbi:unnamed protein product [Rotaria magnacalcarata]|uniref:G-protein coupled receptors family 1 profile domain-containing protein n=1 Tax=Rotaria magnacalcarata TaxID=392030 RepID=A0A820FXD1_9BILA|nr:unnamed protein product [Rotaria magnacalcarata]CAF1437531.1 unnamed protein product [Rotaria magnacalcarata]CAF2031287.1 unnamed protein product [Rotaria magnacalcarata]CAF2111978.1 unnamed protein product [Rotaria magnacalcarata]CAF2178889.1 unnamed protein product [Rotaria magnacalcarata]
MNSTVKNSTVSNLKDYYIVCPLSASFGLLSVMISMMIMIIVRCSKRRLHTVRHLLMCNTCIASAIYCIVQTINYIFLIFIPWETSNVLCRWRGYFGYMSISAAAYSYLIQAVSRLFFSKFSTKYPWLLTFKTHYYLILIHWSIVFIIPLPSVITKDIYFRPGLLCWVPLKSTIHVGYTVFAYYLVPIFFIMVIYIDIYRRIKKANKRAEMVLNTTNDKRDLEVFRNIVILLAIYITGGIPTVIFIIFAMHLFYLVGIVTITLSIFIEKICTIALDRELRLVVSNKIFKKNLVVAIENTITRTKYPATSRRP